MQKEIWKDIPGYENYLVSNLANVKTLSRNIYLKSDSTKLHYIQKEKILKPFLMRGYFCVGLYNNNLSENIKVSVLVAMAFLNHKPDGYKIIVDHIDNNPLNDNLNNLQLISARVNVSKDRKNKTSKYTGVCWSKSNKKWVANITINKKYK